MIEAPIFSEILYWKPEEGEEDDRDFIVDDRECDDQISSILCKTGGYLTVLSKRVVPFAESALEDKLNLNASSTESIIKQSND